MQTVENISEIKKITFDEVFNLNLVEFFNFVAYIVWKNNELKKKYSKNELG